jgi:hypothetical protein
MITNYSDKVRVRHASVDLGDDDILVEKLVDGVWIKHRSFNSLGDNYAHTNAKQCAFKLSTEK